MTVSNIQILVVLIVVIILALVLTLYFTQKKEKYIFSYDQIYNQPKKNLFSTNNPDADYTALKSRVDGYVPLQDGVDTDKNVIKYADEIYMKICCQLALRSAKLENFGIGCVIVDPLNSLKPKLKNATVVIQGKTVNYLVFIKTLLQSLSPEYINYETDPYLNKIVGLGLNQIFNFGFFENQKTPHVRSDRHGEMVSMDLLEDAISTTPYEKEFQIRMPEGLKLYTQLESCPMCMSRLASSSISEVLHGAPDNGGGMVHKLCSLPPIFIGLTNTQKFTPASVSGNINGNKQNTLIQLCMDCFGLTVGTVGTKQNNRVFGCPENCPDYKYCLPAADPDIFTRSGYDLSGFTRY